MIRHAAAVVIVLGLSPSMLGAQTMALTVSTASATVHKTPSTGSPVVGRPARGTTLEVTREVGDWVKVSWPDAPDGVGYVHRSMGSLSRGVAAAQPAAQASAAPMQASAAPMQMAAADQTAIVERPASPGTVYVATPKHVIGVGGRLGGATLGVGASARAWTNSRFGVQADMTRYTLSDAAAPERVTSMQFAPSVLVALPDRVTDYVWLRPYVGGGPNFHRQSLSVPPAGASISESKVGFQTFGGGELTFPSLPRFAVSVDVGYLWSDTPFAGHDLGGVRYSVSGHWYVR